jgi:hypothetical protein
MTVDKLAKPVSGKYGEILRQRLIENRLRHSEDKSTHQQRALQHLMVWQTDRLRQTHQDLFLSPRYHSAAEYFVEELYLSPTAIQRDKDLERVFPTLVKLLPDDTLETVANAIELNILSAELDQQLANLIFQQHPEQAICASQITEQDYVEAYQAANAQAQRQRQLDLIIQIGHDLDHLVRFPFISLTLRLIRKPAHKKGLGSLHDFLERGFNTFKALGGADEFMHMIVEREGKILDNLNQGKLNPFEL